MTALIASPIKRLARPAHHQVRALKVPAAKAYRSSVRAFNIWNDGAPVTEERVREFFAERIQTRATRTVRKDKVAIKAALLESLGADDSITMRASISYLFAEIRTEKPSESVTADDVLTRAEVLALMETASPRLRLIVRALYNTGCRISELLSIELRRCRPCREGVKMSFTGKRKKERSVVISADLFQDIRQEFSSRRFLFENPRTVSGRVSRQTVSKQLRTAARKALGKNRRVHPHLFRHTRLTHLLQGGEDLGAVSRFAGHARPDFTARVYGHNVVTAQTQINTGI